MEDSCCFVQFIHPGGEHRPDAPGRRSWNTGPHRRKFLRSAGRYFFDGRGMEGDIVFWGEWEPESRVVAKFDKPAPGGPRFLYEPYLRRPLSLDWRQNTDPYVFGDRFLYTGCLQWAGGRPTQLRNLDKGSIILFGSCVERSRFVLDTVFVVDESVDHGPKDHESRLARIVSEGYRLATIEPMYLGEVSPSQSFRLYLGATPEGSVDGMFSFIPCRTYEEGVGGFLRPQIQLPGYVTQGLFQGKKIARNVDLGDLKYIWHEVVRQVTAQDLALGVEVTAPPIQ